MMTLLVVLSQSQQYVMMMNLIVMVMALSVLPDHGNVMVGLTVQVVQMKMNV